MTRVVTCLIALAACGGKRVERREHGPEIVIVAAGADLSAREIETQIAVPIEEAIGSIRNGSRPRVSRSVTSPMRCERSRPIPIVLRAARASVRSGDGTLVPTANLVETKAVREPAEILREDRLPWTGVRVTGDPVALRDALDKLAVPAGYRAGLIAR